MGSSDFCLLVVSSQVTDMSVRPVTFTRSPVEKHTSLPHSSYTDPGTAQVNTPPHCYNKNPFHLALSSDTSHIGLSESVLMFYHLDKYNLKQITYTYSAAIKKKIYMELNNCQNLTNKQNMFY